MAEKFNQIIDHWGTFPLTSVSVVLDFLLLTWLTQLDLGNLEDLPFFNYPREEFIYSRILKKRTSIVFTKNKLW